MYIDKPIYCSNEGRILNWFLEHGKLDKKTLLASIPYSVRLNHGAYGMLPSIMQTYPWMLLNGIHNSQKPYQPTPETLHIINLNNAHFSKRSMADITTMLLANHITGINIAYDAIIIELLPPRLILFLYLTGHIDISSIITTSIDYELLQHIVDHSIIMGILNNKMLPNIINILNKIYTLISNTGYSVYNVLDDMIIGMDNNDLEAIPLDFFQHPIMQTSDTVQYARNLITLIGK